MTLEKRKRNSAESVEGVKGEAINHRSNQQHNNCSFFQISISSDFGYTLSFHFFILLSLISISFSVLFTLNFVYSTKTSQLIFFLLPYTPFSPTVLLSSSYLLKRCRSNCHNRKTWLLVFYNGEHISPFLCFSIDTLA